MMLYRCHVCHGLCDPGELENGVCFECRQEELEKEAEREAMRSLEIMKEFKLEMERRKRVLCQNSGNGGM